MVGYVSLPPPYTHLYSLGSPSGEVHSVTDGAIVPFKLQELLYTDEGEGDTIPDQEDPFRKQPGPVQSCCTALFLRFSLGSSVQFPPSATFQLHEKKTHTGVWE